MGEATGYEAKTIHRMLEYSFRKGGFQRKEQRPLDCDLLIIDEASMIDTVLMHHLMKAIPPGATLILVGDVNQLPSVGPGNVLRDIIGSGTVSVVELNEIFRQAKKSLIIVNAHHMNNGLMPLLSTGKNESDFYFIEEQDPDEAPGVIIKLVTDRIPRRFGFGPLEDIQVLTPMHKGTVGVANLNTMLQEALNSRGEGVERGSRVFRRGDKVIQLTNNYDKEVFNGDMGRIAGVDLEGQVLTVCFEGRDVDYDFSDLDEIALAYAIPVHKSQGSEYPAVVITIFTQHYALLQRNLIYTAVTRARKLVVMVGTKKALAIAVRDNKPERRYTCLAQRLCG